MLGVAAKKPPNSQELWMLLRVLLVERIDESKARRVDIVNEVALGVQESVALFGTLEFKMLF